MTSHGLTQAQVETIRQIIISTSNTVEKVALFGSRAKGTQQPHSDIDLVIYGDLTDALVNRLWTLFEASSLPYKVDVKAYSLIDYSPLKNHIDRVAQVLLTQQDLLSV